MIFISVNTPTKTRGIGSGQAIDLKYVEASSREISKYAKGPHYCCRKKYITC